MKWKQKLEECGLNEQTISVGLKNKIKDYYTIIDGIEETKESIANPTLNDDVEELQSELSDLEDALLDSDTKLVRAIEVFDKNKERYAEMSKHLGNGRPRKDGTPNAPRQTQAQPQAQSQSQSKTKDEPNGEGKKGKSAFGWIGVAALVVVGAFVGVNLLKNRD
jgi:hypothetical protein